ncbi:hypothetical protein [Streptomyces lydicus]|uniref:hypothetical protein n=1 Tax=Streptomyces lydicus TaxID=47763 RepID=UPI00379FA92F
MDWTMRIKVTPGDVAEAKARRKARELAGQAGEYEGETAGVPTRGLDAAGALVVACLQRFGVTKPAMDAA